MNENKQPSVGVGALILSDDGKRILMSKRIGSHAEGTYGTAGGHVDFGEHPIDSLRRECKEELDITIKNIKFVHCLSMIRYGKHYIDLTFSAQIDDGVPKIMEPDKREGLDWYDLDNLPEPLFEPVKIGLDLYKSKSFYKEITE